MFEGTKVVTADEMLRIEQLAYAQGFSDGDFMEQAGVAISRFIEKNYPSKRVVILAGKGNNGGDAYTAGIHLLDKGFSVQAIRVFPLEGSSPLCIQQHDRFVAKGGKVHEESAFPESGVILDGLVGTGFKGKAEGVLAGVIEEANQSGLPIVAIDIPSGISGNTGEGKIAIEAKETVYLGLPKIGFYIGNGWNHVGHLIPADFGLPSHFLAQAKVEAYLPDLKKIHLPPIVRNRHKYQTGYVIGIAGSETMPGAAFLSALSALRSGAGLVRLFHLPGMSGCGAPWEVIREKLDPKRVMEECGRASAAFVGPGLGRTKEVKKLLAPLLGKLPHPTVVDADALFHMAEPPQMDLPAKTILTPHHQEMSRLLGGAHPSLAACQKFADEIHVTVVLKGGPTLIFHPHTKPLIVSRGDPGMATAGTGDVLTGVITALLSQQLEPRMAATLGAYLHAVAGEKAVAARSPYSLIASDIIEALAEVFNEFANQT